MAKNARQEQPDSSRNAMTVVVTPHETVEPQRSSATDRISQGFADGARVATQAAGATGRVARSVGQSIGKSASEAAKASAALGSKATKAASATLDFVGDLNGDGKFDVEDLRIAKATAAKVALEVGGEAASLGKAALRHPLTKDAAAAALVGGAVGAALPLVTVAVGAAAGAAFVVAKVAPSAAVEAVGRGAGEAAKLAKAGLKSTKRRKTTRPADPKA